MEVLPVDPDRPQPAVLARAADALRAGDLLIYPTDTLYALGGRALEPAVGRKVRAAKGRPENQPLPLVAADVEQARSLCAAWPRQAARLAGRFWPGPLTLVLPARPDVPAEVTAGTGTVALRVPARELARRLCVLAGPIISTSANLAGGAGALTCAEAVRAVGPAAALALDGGEGRPLPSTIVDLSGGEPKLLRAGAVAWPDVLGVLG